MSPMAGPEELVSPPPLSPPSTSLLSTLQTLDGDDRIIGGIRHRPENYQPLVGIDPCANTAVVPIYSGVPARVFRAFVAQEADRCSAFGWQDNDYQGRATRGLMAKESPFVETELEQGVLVPDNPALARPGSINPADVAVTAGSALMTSASNPFRAYMKGWEVVGPYWAAGAKVFITDVLSAGQVLVSETARKTVSVTTTAAGVGLTATAGTFDTVRDVGAQVGDNPNIPAGRTLATVTSGTAATLNSGTGVTAATGVPTTITPVVNMTGLSVTFTDPGFVQLAGGTAVSPSLAMAYLNGAIADAQLGTGLIHLPAFAAERIYENRGVINSSGAAPSKLWSVNGNPVIVGNGYKGLGPDGSGGSPSTQAPAGTVYQWAYATDLIQVIRPVTPRVYPDSLAAAMDRSTNLVSYLASRPYVINWSGLLRAAVKIAVTT